MTRQPATPHAATPARPAQAAAVEYWDQVLDPQNLEREGRAPGLSLDQEIDFAATPDLLAALRWLEARPAAAAPQTEFIVDLGAGLGAQAFALARRGHNVLAVDSSPARLRELKRRARLAGCSDRIRCAAALAERLPFRDGSLPALYTKSVLIHTAMPAAAAELARVLRPGGRAALIEPQPGNPFAALYRRLLAPRAWQSITTYFSPREQAVFASALQGRFLPARHVKPCYFLGFIAFVFQFGWPCLPLFRAALALLAPLDSALFALCPPLRRAAWFGVLTLQNTPSPAKDHAA